VTFRASNCSAAAVRLAGTTGNQAEPAVELIPGCCSCEKPGACSMKKLSTEQENAVRDVARQCSMPLKPERKSQELE
jgi:coenzyme F420-reducing hydrogenase delta subunit